MRIAVVTTSWPRSEGDPAGHFVRTEAQALSRDGHDVAVVAPAPGGAFGWPGVAARVRESPSRAIEAAMWVAHARRRLGRMRADRVIAHWAIPCAWPIGVAAPGIPIEVVSHGGDVRLLGGFPSLVRRAIVDAVSARADRWRFVSAPLAEQLLARLDRASRTRLERIATVCAPLIDMPDVGEAVALRRRELGGLRVAVSVGRLVASKRVDRAIERVARSRDVDALIVIGDGPDRQRLERLAADRGVDARFVGLVARREALAWIGVADVLLHASCAEGLSTVLREAEALGTRVETVVGTE
jgi:teichuronic acid biosynthesis glycosyltransferase TuaC